MKRAVKTVIAKAKCASFDITIVATIESTGLIPSEIEDVKRKLKQKLSTVVASLPFAHIYPCEVKVK